MNKHLDGVVIALFTALVLLISVLANYTIQKLVKDSIKDKNELQYYKYLLEECEKSRATLDYHK